MFLLSFVCKFNSTQKGKVIMKNIRLLVGLIVVLLTGKIISMEESNEGRLHFLLDENRCVKLYSAQNMNFYGKPADFVDKDILKFLPLNYKDSNNFMKAFKKAVNDNEKLKVSYTLQGEKFLAQITPLYLYLSRRNFFVEIKKANEQ